MEEHNYEKLIKKVLEFWRNHDGKEFDATDVKAFFDYDELATVLYNDKFICMYYRIVRDFKDKLLNIKNLFTNKEAEDIFNKFADDSDYDLLEYDLLKYFSDEKLLSILSNKKSSKAVLVSRCLSSDEARIAAFNMVEDQHFKAKFIRALDDEQLKLQYIKKISKEYRSYVISSFKDHSLIEKQITLFAQNKGVMISKLSSDEKKIYYFKKFFSVLNNDDKADILSSLKNEELILYYFNYVNDHVKSAVICDSSIRSEVFYEKAALMIKNKNTLIPILEHSNISERLYVSFIEKITNMNALYQLVISLGDERRNKYLDKFLEKFNDKKKMKLFNEFPGAPVLSFKILKSITDKKLIFPLIEHCEQFPPYSEEYGYIIDLYVEKYNLDKQRLIMLCNKCSFSILKAIENENIIKILNSSEEEFSIIIQLFNKENLNMNPSSMNDALNTFLQRDFRLKFSSTILLFPNALNAIENNDKATLLTILDTITDSINIKEEISKNNWSFQQFVDMLLAKDDRAIELLHNIINQYITNKRNEYIKEKLEPTLQSVTIPSYEKNDLMKYMFSNYPLELLLLLIPEEEFFDEKDFELYTSEEVEFLKNRDLIKSIISYKKNPSSYYEIPLDVKSNLRAFNNLFEKIFIKNSVNRFPDADVCRKSYQYKTIDQDFLVNIMMNLNVDIMRKNLFNNPEVLKKMLRIWEQYKIGAWGNNFDEIIENLGISVDAEVIANFIQYFDLSYGILQEKVDKGELANISLTALFDLAACYSSDSKKYSMVFGQENFRYLAGNFGPNAATMAKEKRIKKSVHYLKKIRERKFVSVPPLDQNFELKNGKNMNVVVGNFSNIINLTYGERTGACMRIGGAGDSLFDFCLEDDNGFHIRFSDPTTNKFISRVSGFRNGNTVFLNQLRFSVDSDYTNKDVVEACKLVSEEIIRISKNSDFPIENVVISTCYSMRESEMKPQDLNIDNPQAGMKNFYTDVSSNSIVLASSRASGELTPIKLGNRKVPKYLVQRDKKQIFYNKQASDYLTHLKCLDQVLSGVAVDDVVVEKNENIIVSFAGEDWCVTIDKQGNIDTYFMKNTNNKQQAMDEAQEALIYLKENLEKEMAISSNMSLGM